MRRDLHYLEMIVQSVEAFFEYIKDKSEAEFYNDDVLKHAVLMRLIVIEEYGGKVSLALQNRFSAVIR